MSNNRLSTVPILVLIGQMRNTMYAFAREVQIHESSMSFDIALK